MAAAPHVEARGATHAAPPRSRSAPARLPCCLSARPPPGLSIPARHERRGAHHPAVRFPRAAPIPSSLRDEPAPRLRSSRARPERSAPAAPTSLSPDVYIEEGAGVARVAGPLRRGRVRHSAAARRSLWLRPLPPPFRPPRGRGPLRPPATVRRVAAAGAGERCGAVWVRGERGREVP